MPDFEYEINMDCSLKDMTDCELPGGAFLWGKDGANVYGVEYIFSIEDDGRINSSAIYPMFDYGAFGILTDHDTWIHYEIDFDSPTWEDDLVQAMTDAYFEWERDYDV